MSIENTHGGRDAGPLRPCDEISNREAKESDYKNIVKDELEKIKFTPIESLRARNDERLKNLISQRGSSCFSKEDTPPLTEDEKKKIKEETGWPDENIVKDELEKIKSTPLESLRARNDERLKNFKPEPSYFSRVEKPHLTEDQKKKIKEETGWPDEIIDSIASWEEYEIYKKAGLKAEKINGKWCLIRTDIDWNQKDEFGRTNKERAELGLAPLDKNGKPIELHHIGQNPDSPLAELTPDEHRGKGNDFVLHDKSQDSKIDRDEFRREKEEHWKGRTKKN
jgi:hypothetical protein